jgi:integrase
MLRDAAKQEKYTTIVDIIRQIALTGCRRSEMIDLKWTEADIEASCLRAADTIAGYIQGLLDGIEFKQTAYALDRGRSWAKRTSSCGCSIWLSPTRPGYIDGLSLPRLGFR